ncbi:MAG: glycine zipper 2TM domain-containing protein [Ancalomicrobiaceae bacterium]|nr:glycine zipper 2TM domain-containing protein [Ancalomicrobiaceae bacterium]
MKFNPVIVLALIGLVGCTPGAPKQDAGTLAGGLTGGLVGSQFGTGTGKILTTGAGALFGALLGSEIGRELDERDRTLTAEAEFDALETGQPGVAREWRNPANDHHGQVTPGPSYSVNNYVCRDFSDRVYVSDRQPAQSHATACRQPDGSWRPLS